MAGVGTVVKAIRPAARVYGIQSETSRPWVESFRAGRVVSVTYAATLADGLAGGIDPENFPVVRPVTDDMRSVTEAAVQDAMVGLAGQHRLIVEGAGAVGVAALITDVVHAEPGSHVLVVLSGGNVDPDSLLDLMHG